VARRDPIPADRKGRAAVAALPLVATTLEPSENLVQQVGDLLKRRRAGVSVQKVRDRAQQIPEQVAGTRLGGDVP
jgi:hypothetical protein